MNRILLRQAFGLTTDPWAKLDLQTADTQAVSAMVGAAIRDRSLVQIVGPTGQGKSHAFRRAGWGIDGYHPDRDLITLARLDREARTIADIVTAIYRTLNRPRPLGSAEVRDYQLRQVLGEASTIIGGKVTRHLVLMLDDAHLLHWRTIVALKGLREVHWQGVSPLIGIVLLSQRDCLGRTKEIGQRADTYTMSGPTKAETRAALEQTVTRALTPEAIGAIADAAGPGRTWNDLIECVDRSLAIAQAAGHRQVELIDAVQASGGGLREMARAVGISQAEIARQTELSETTVSRIFSGERKDAEAQARIASLLMSTPASSTQVPARAVGGG